MNDTAKTGDSWRQLRAQARAPWLEWPRRASGAAYESASGRKASRRGSLVGVASALALVVASLAGSVAPAVADSCANASVRAGSSAKLPDCRAYELVTPVSKPAEPIESGGWRSGATTDGEHFFLTSYGPLLSDEQQQPTIYRMDRAGGGWVTKAAVPPGNQAAIPLVLANFADDLSAVILTPQNYDAADQDFFSFNGAPVPPFNGPDFYGLDPNGVPRWLSRGEISNDVPNALVQPMRYQSTPDGAHVVFTSTVPLLPSAVGIQPGPLGGLYDSASGHLSLIGVDNAGNRLTDGDVLIGGSQSSLHALSDDGSKIFFTAVDGDPSNPSGNAGLYIRENDHTTMAIPDGVAPSPTRDFLAATPDGSKVFFATTEQLTGDDADTSADLYEYDVATHALQRISAGAAPAAVQPRPVYSSDDGSRVYFTAVGDLVSGKGTPGIRKTFVYDRGQLKFVADGDNLALADNSFTGSVSCSSARVTADGRYLVFQTGTQATPDDTDNQSDVYRYDAVAHTLINVSRGSADGNGPYDASINPHTGVAGQPVGFGCDSNLQHATHPVSRDGRYVFFQTGESLVSQDTNGKEDVYEYDAATGETHLISSGTSRLHSVYLDSTPSGSDVFFTTNDALVQQDTDGNADVYDARVGGGFPPPAQVLSCGDDECQASGSDRPAFAVPGTVAFAGATGPSGRLAVNKISASALRQFARTGRLKLRVVTTAAGRISAIATSRVGSGSRVVARSSATTHGAERVTLTLKLSRTAMRLLTHTGRMHLSLTVREPGVGATSVAFLLRKTQRRHA